MASAPCGASVHVKRAEKALRQGRRPRRIAQPPVRMNLATASDPMRLPMAIPTSVELR
jgi:hypothetical protein